ncbi:MAG: chloride channel protein [Lachnospiraceae bacterium]
MKNMKKFIGLSFGRVRILLKWIISAGLTGVIMGVVGAYFARAITYVTALRDGHPWMLYLLPVAGFFIAFIYRWENVKGGTNLVLESVRTEKEIPFRTAPMIFAATVITHMFGGSAGREGAALQLGGSIANTLGRLLKLEEKDKRIMIMCGMAAGFSALFGTPLAATVFAMEVVSVGIMQYSALVPCTIAALTAHEVAMLCGGGVEVFHVTYIPEFGLITGGKAVILAMFCAGLSIAFCMLLHGSEHLYKKYFPNAYVRIFAGGIFVAVLAKSLGTTDYLGSGMHILELAVEGKVIYSAFFLKMIFTALTLGAGYKGGEIVPTLFVGATFGCMVGQIIGLSPSLCAACGMMAMFSGVTNSPMASLMLSFELFGFEGMPYYLISVAIGYMASGYYGLYHSQKVMYSKEKPEYVGRQVKH